MFIEDYVKNKYFFQSYDVDDGVMIFLQQKNTSDIERCITCASLLCEI